MCATDVSPNRLTVAQDAALSFIQNQAADTRIGVIAFADFAEIIVPPTNDKDELERSVRNLTTAFGTAIGSATLKSIDAIAEVNEAVAPSGLNLRTEENPIEGDEAVYLPEIIVLLTDGANSQGPRPLAAAQQAADRGLRVYTIGFGTTELSAMVCSREQLGSNIFGPGGIGGGFGSGGGFSGGGGGGNFRRFLVIDEPTLQAVADITGGSYFRAESADQLNEIFQELPTQIVLQKETQEISVIFVALGAILATIAVALSLLWNRFP
jgi:Ca-activated chloride channel family protein